LQKHFHKVKKISSLFSLRSPLSKRRSHRSFIDEKISAGDISQILWAAYGITQPLPERPGMKGGLRTAPSAGATYPLRFDMTA